MYAGMPTKMPVRAQPQAHASAATAQAQAQAHAQPGMLCGTMKYARHPSLLDGFRSGTKARDAAQETVRSSGDAITDTYFKHSTAKRINTDSVIAQAIKKEYPGLELVIVPQNGWISCDLLAFAAAGNAKATPVEDDSNNPSVHTWTMYFPPARRMGGNKGALGDKVIYGKFIYQWGDEEFIVYLADGRDGAESYPNVKNFYILAADRQKADDLVLAVGSWSSDLHNEIWVFDQGMFLKDPELWESMMQSTWDQVILDEDMKKSLIDDHLSFFNSKETYNKLGVPWKRGLIYHGPPGNGKTISIKATMHMLADRNIPTIYVRSLESWMGPQYSLHMIFEKAREFAPCYLVLEDIDTLIDPMTRSYFLNEVDGLKQNDGLFIIASTNHLDRLDPGISKRPSRFDRKYFFPDPNVDEREAYCRFWRNKLKSNEDIEFPDKLCRAIAEITDKFSFAYIQEAFVATLLAIARRSKTKRTSGSSTDAWVIVSDDEESEKSFDGDDLDKLVLWVEMKKQVKILREGMEEEEEL